MSSGHGGFRVGSGWKHKIQEESAESEDGAQQHCHLGAPTNFSSEEIKSNHCSLCPESPSAVTTLSGPIIPDSGTERVLSEQECSTPANCCVMASHEFQFVPCFRRILSISSHDLQLVPCFHWILSLSTRSFEGCLHFHL